MLFYWFIIIIIQHLIIPPENFFFKFQTLLNNKNKMYIYIKQILIFSHCSCEQRLCENFTFQQILRMFFINQTYKNKMTSVDVCSKSCCECAQQLWMSRFECEQKETQFSCFSWWSVNAAWWRTGVWRPAVSSSETIVWFLVPPQHGVISPDGGIWLAARYSE